MGARCAVAALLGPLLLAATWAAPALGSNDEYSSAQWGLRTVGAEQAWKKGTGRGVVIAVVDTGVDASHEDLKANVVRGRDFVGHDDDSRDENGHGTHVAGIAAAVANNGIGVAGVAPNAKIMPVRALDANGQGDLGTIEDAVRYAVDKGAKVVNLSLGADVVTENLTGGTLTDAVNYAWDHGAIAVVAAGNDSLFRTELRQAKAIIVTATTPDDRLASYATGVGLAPWGMAAPGGTDEGGRQNMIISTYWSKTGTRYAYAMGTSMAAPHVSGAAAVLLGLGLSPQATVDRLLGTAKDLGAPGNDPTFGHGRLDVARAVGGLEGVEGSGSGTAATETAAPRRTVRPLPERTTAPLDVPVVPGAPVVTSRPATEVAPRSSGGASAPRSTPARSAAPGAMGRASGDHADGAGRKSQLPNVLTGLAVLSVAGGAWAYTRLAARRSSR